MLERHASKMYQRGELNAKERDRLVAKRIPLRPRRSGTDADSRYRQRRFAMVGAVSCWVMTDLWVQIVRLPEHMHVLDRSQWRASVDAAWGRTGVIRLWRLLVELVEYPLSGSEQLLVTLAFLLAGTVLILAVGRLCMAQWLKKVRDGRELIG